MLLPGTRLGPYTIVDLVAVGGMGEVYRAEDTRLHREVAIKVLPSHLADDQTALERFRREARAVASLSHPNILAIFDFGYEDGVQFAVTELLEGETLRARISRGALPPREALELMREIAEGVAAAHARGLVHRDLKPENIFITTSGRVKVLDFGLARSGTGAVAHAHAVTEIQPTEPGIVLGTIGYLAPEQVEGLAATTASDVFALGCILYELVTGTLPFSGTSSAQAMVAVLRDSAPRLQSNDPLMRFADTIVQHCLEKKPAARPKDAGELRDTIASVLGGETRTLKLKPLPRTPLKTRLLAGAVAALVLLTAGFFVLRARNRQIDHGLDLRASDVRGDAETKQLLELALRADADGNRAKAMQLLEEVSRRPSARTALPAGFLSSFYDAAGDFERARTWGDVAMKKLAGASTYESLLVRYLVVSSRDRAQELALARSCVEIRPHAWRLRLAAVHIYLGARDREAARRELQRIDVGKPDDRRLMFVLADRASLGDIEGAERDLEASRLVERPALLHYTRARIAWSRGDARRAQQLYDRAADDAAAEGLTPMEAESRLLAGIALLRLGEWAEAQRRFAMTASRARQFGLKHRLYDSAALAAYAAHRNGDAAERDRKLLESASVQPPSGPASALRLLAIRLRSPVWKSWSLEPLANEPQLAPVMPLIRAREAWFAGDLAAAKQELQRARAGGIEVSDAREEAELLAAELGLPSQVLPPDPPYPNILRYVAIFDHPKFER